jgi:hypothetical protein
MNVPARFQAALAAALLAECAWLARPTRLLPRLEPGLGAPPALGAPARGAAGIAAPPPPDGPPAAGSAGEGDEDLRDAVAGAASGAASGAAAARAGRLAGAAFMGGASARGAFPSAGGAGRARSLADELRARSADAARRAAAAASAAASARRDANSRTAALRAQDRAELGAGRAGEPEPRGGAARGPGAATGRPSSSARAEGGKSGRGGAAAGARRRASLFEPAQDAETSRTRSARRRRRRGEERAEGARESAADARRFRPLLLKDELGAKPLRPPAANLEPPPALLTLPERLPSSDAAGNPTPRGAASLAAVEELNPKALPADRHAGAHWDGAQWHDGAARGVEQGGAWLPLYHDRDGWWALAGRPAAPLLRHGGAWWVKNDGVWLVVHDGEPWAVRSFHDWDAQGLFHPGSGTEIVYSADYARAAVITPGRGAEVFDARTGASLGTIPEDQMPARRRPTAPASLPTPQ